MHNLNNGKHNSSNFARVIIMLKSVDSANESTSIVAYVDDDKIRFDFSH